MNILTLNVVPAGSLAATGGAGVPPWVWFIAGALVLLGIVFFLLRRRSGDDMDPEPGAQGPSPTIADAAVAAGAAGAAGAGVAAAAPIIAAVDPTVGDGPGTTQIPTETPEGDAAMEDLFRPGPDAVAGAGAEDAPAPDFGGADEMPPVDVADSDAPTIDFGSSDAPDIDFGDSSAPDAGPTDPKV